MNMSDILPHFDENNFKIQKEKYILFFALRIRRLKTPNKCKKCKFVADTLLTSGTDTLLKHFIYDCPKFMKLYEKNIATVISELPDRDSKAHIRVEKRLRKEITHKHRCQTCEKIFRIKARFNQHKCRHSQQKQVKCYDAPRKLKNYKHNRKFDSKNEPFIMVSVAELKKLDRGDTPFIRGYKESVDELECPKHPDDDCCCVRAKKRYDRSCLIYKRDKRREKQRGWADLTMEVKYNVVWMTYALSENSYNYEMNTILKIPPLWYEIHAREQETKEDAPHIYTPSVYQKILFKDIQETAPFKSKNKYSNCIVLKGKKSGKIILKGKKKVEQV